MRHAMTIFLALGLAQACAHESAASSERTPVARSPEEAGGERVCGNAQVFFAAGSAELDDVARERLDRYATCLADHEFDVIYVSGTTDPVGSDEENLALGRTRARAVADYLHDQGCHVDFVIRSFGERDALSSPPLWPVERAVDATAVATD
jgi:outer membrane protein OmpA-like peptidoglycan-associated protein